MPFLHNEELAQRVRSKQPHPPTRIVVEATALAANDGRTSGTEARLARLRKRIGTDVPSSSPCPKKANLAKLLGAVAGLQMVTTTPDADTSEAPCH